MIGFHDKMMRCIDACGSDDAKRFAMVTLLAAQAGIAETDDRDALFRFLLDMDEERLERARTEFRNAVVGFRVAREAAERSARPSSAPPAAQ